MTATAKRINTGGIISSREGAFPVVITAIEPSIEATYSLQAENIGEGRFLQDGEGDAIVIGKGLADLLAVGSGDRVTLLGRGKNDQMRQRTMTIVGIYDLGMPDAETGTVFITLSEAQSLYNLRDEVTEISINLQNIGQASTVMPALQKALPGVEIDSFDTLRPEIRETIRTKLAFTTMFGLIVIFIACIGILNIQMMAVFERTREMGVLAALGMKGRQVTGLFLLEGTLIGVVGATIGCLLGVALLAWLKQVGIGMPSVSGMGDVVALMGDRIYPSISLTGIISRGCDRRHHGRDRLALPGLAGLPQTTGGGVAPCVRPIPGGFPMALGKLWTLAWRDLGRNRRRTLFSVIAVALGLALLIMMNGLIAGARDDSLRNSIRFETGHVQLRASSYDDRKLSLQWKDLLAEPDALAAQAKALPEVKAVAPVLWAGSVLTTRDESTDLKLFGIDTESAIYDPFRQAMVAGEFLTPDDRSGILISGSLADSLGIGVGDKVNLAVVNANGEPDDSPFTVRGLFQTGFFTYDDGAVLMPLSKAQAYTGTDGHASAIVVLLNKKEDAEKVATALQSPGVTPFTYLKLNEAFLQTLRVGHGLLCDPVRHRDPGRGGDHRQHAVDGGLRAHPGDGNSRRAGHEGTPGCHDVSVGSDHPGSDRRRAWDPLGMRHRGLPGQGRDTDWRLCFRGQRHRDGHDHVCQL